MADTFSALHVHCVFATKIVNLWWWAKSRSDFGCSWVESQSKIKRSTASALKNDLFGIDRAAVFGASLRDAFWAAP